MNAIAANMLRHILLPFACLALLCCSSGSKLGITERIQNTLNSMNRQLADPTIPQSRRDALTRIRDCLMDPDVIPMMMGHSVPVYATYLIIEHKLVIETHWVSDKFRITTIRLMENGHIIYSEDLCAAAITRNELFQSRFVTFDYAFVVKKVSLFNEALIIDPARPWKLELLDQNGAVAAAIYLKKSLSPTQHDPETSEGSPKR